MNIALMELEGNADEEDAIGVDSGNELSSKKDEVEFDPTKLPVLQDCFAKTEAAAAAIAASDINGDKFFGDTLPVKLRTACTVYVEAYGSHSKPYIGHLEWTVGSIFCYLGRGVHPATGEDCQAIEYEDFRGNCRRLLIPFTTIAKGGADLGGYLSANGFCVGTEPKARALTQEMLNNLSGRGVVIRDRLGWAPGQELVFAYKDCVLGDVASAKVVFDTHAQRHIKTGKRGTYEAWRKNAELLRGNRRSIFMHSVMAASAFSKFAPQADTLTVAIRGDTTDGKSTEAYVAGSMHGGGEGKGGFMHTWDGTPGAMQALAAAHSDIGVIFDEVSQAGEHGQRTAYAIHNGSGRNRLNRDASLRRSEETRTFVLSTGETDFSEMAGLKGKSTVYGGLEARTVIVPSDAGSGLGIYEDLHGLPRTKDGARQFANKRKLSAGLDYGHAGPMIVRNIIDECAQYGEDAFRRKLAVMIEQFVEGLHLPNDADAAVRRVASSFGLICAAGRFSCRWDILPLEEREIIEAAAVCFNAWIAERGGTKARSTASSVIVLRDYIAKHMGRFIPMSEAATTTASTICGYRDGQTFYMLSSAWHEVMQSAPRAKLAEELATLGLLERQGSSTATRTWQSVKKIGGSQIRCYPISSRILSLSDDGKLLDADDTASVTDLNTERTIRTLRKSTR